MYPRPSWAGLAWLPMSAIQAERNDLNVMIVVMHSVVHVVLHAVSAVSADAAPFLSS